MLTQKELIRTPEYWQEKIQNDLYHEVLAYMEAKNLNRTDLAHEWQVSKGYVSQVMNGSFNFTISKLIELALNMDLAPVMDFKSMNEVNSFEMLLPKEYVTSYPISNKQCRIVPITNKMTATGIMDYPKEFIPIAG